jgi:hypothetical protein
MLQMCLHISLRGFLCVALGCAPQVYVGDYIKVDVGDENSKGWSIGQVEELYQTVDVSWDYQCCFR